MKSCRMAMYFLASALTTSQAFVLPKYHVIVQQPLMASEANVEHDNKLLIPGDSPVRHCADPANDLFTIDRIDLFSNPPKRGQSVVVEIEGNFEKDVEDEPRFMLNATFGSMKSIDTVENLCDHVDVVQDQALRCPPKKGHAVITYVFFINQFMPTGDYTVRVDAYTKEDDSLFCLFAAVTLD